MRFTLEVDVGAMPEDADVGKELGRILRYWGGAFPKIELQPGQRMAIYDSEYREVGHWTVTEPPTGA